MPSKPSAFLAAALTCAALVTAAAQERGPQELTPDAIKSSVDALGNLDFPTRMNAARALRRAPPAAVAPMLIEAVQSHNDQFVRFRALVLLTAFNDNALITYLATLVPDFSESLKIAVVEGAVTGGGLTVIANAPNPAGQALLGRFFDDSVSPVRLFAAAVVPTLIAAAMFRMIS